MICNAFRWKRSTKALPQADHCNRPCLDRCKHNCLRAWHQVALEREEAAEEQSVQYLDLEGETDEDGNSLEEEFEEEKGRRSLASIFESDEEDVLQVDANLQDETLLVLLSLLLMLAEFCGWQAWQKIPADLLLSTLRYFISQLVPFGGYIGAPSCMILNLPAYSR